MLPEKIHLEIVTPERRVLERDVDEVVLPGHEGSFGVLPGHAPLLVGLQPGVAHCRGAGGDETMAISSGYAEVLPDRVIVLAATCEKAEEIDVERANDKVKALEKDLQEGHADSEPEVLRFRMMKHLARIDASKRAP